MQIASMREKLLQPGRPDSKPAHEALIDVAKPHESRVHSSSPGLSSEFQAPVSTCPLAWLPRALEGRRPKQELVTYPAPFFLFQERMPPFSPSVTPHIPPSPVSSSFKVFLQSVPTFHLQCHDLTQATGLSDGEQPPRGLPDSLACAFMALLKGSHSNIFKMPIRSGRSPAQSPSVGCSSPKGSRLIAGPEQGKDRVGLEQLIVSESKTYSKIDGDTSKTSSRGLSLTKPGAI